MLINLIIYRLTAEALPCGTRRPRAGTHEAPVRAEIRTLSVYYNNNHKNINE